MDGDTGRKSGDEAMFRFISTRRQTWTLGNVGRTFQDSGGLTFVN